MKQLPIQLVEQDDGTVRATAAPEVTGHQIQAAIRALGFERQDRLPGHSTDPPMSVLNGIEPVEGREWQMVKLMEGGSALTVLHPMYGWLAFRARPQLLAAIVRALEQALQEPPDQAHLQ